jgi:hypothetical protein
MIIDKKRLYGSAKMSIPRPVFIVLYNGKEYFPAVKTLKLSDLFKEVKGCNDIALEVEVTVYNINKGVNPVIEERSPTLSGYAELVGKARENEAAGLDKNEAVKQAADFCIKHGILAGFLKEHISEVENMSLLEWTLEDALQVSKEEGIEEGLEKGREDGREETQELVYKLIDQAKSMDDLKRLLETSLPRQQNGAGAV